MQENLKKEIFDLQKQNEATARKESWYAEKFWQKIFGLLFFLDDTRFICEYKIIIRNRNKKFTFKNCAFTFWKATQKAQI